MEQRQDSTSNGRHVVGLLSKEFYICSPYWKILILILLLHLLPGFKSSSALTSSGSRCHVTKSVDGPSQIKESDLLLQELGDILHDL